MSSPKRFKITIEGNSINLPKDQEPKCNKVIPKFELRDAVTVDEDRDVNYYLSIDKIKFERIE